MHTTRFSAAFQSVTTIRPAPPPTAFPAPPPPTSAHATIVTLEAMICRWLPTLPSRRTGPCTTSTTTLGAKTPPCTWVQAMLQERTPQPTRFLPRPFCLLHLVQVAALVPHPLHSRSGSVIDFFCLESRTRSRGFFDVTTQVTCRGTFRDHFPVDQVPVETSLLLICPPRGSSNKLTLSPSLRLLRKLSSLTIANSGVSYCK